MVETKSVKTLERARDAFVDIRGAIEDRTGKTIDKVPVEEYDDIIRGIPRGNARLKGINITPSKEPYRIRANEEIDGYNDIRVYQVSSSIDDNIRPENIKKGVTILNVEGTYECSNKGGQSGTQAENKAKLQVKTVYITHNRTEITPDSGFDAISSVVAYCIASEGIKVKPSREKQEFYPTIGTVGIDKVTVEGDNNLRASNIREGITIFGVAGTYNESNSKIPKYQDKTVKAEIHEKNIQADSEFDALGTVKILPVDKSIDDNIKAENIKAGVSILGVTGTLATDMVPRFSNSYTNNNGVIAPESEELRALIRIDEAIHLFCNGKHYRFDDNNLEWKFIDSNSKFCGKDKASRIDNIANTAVLIGRYVVWIGGELSGDQYVCYYNVDTKVVGDYIKLGEQKWFASCIATDGKSLYVFDKGGNKIRKVAINFENGTAVVTDVVTGFTNKILAMGVFNGKLYGHDGSDNPGLFEIDIAKGTFTKVGDLDKYVNGGKFRTFLVTDDAIFIGGGISQSSVYKWDGTSLSKQEMNKNDAYASLNGGSALCILKGKVYLYGYKENANVDIYTSKFGVMASGVGEHLVIKSSNARQEIESKPYYTKIIIEPAS